MKRAMNRYDLPLPLVSAVNYDEYSSGRGDINTTGLILPERIRQLERRYRDQIVEDPSEKIWRMLGAIGHKIIERADTTNHLSEEHLYAEIGGWTISGRADLLGPEMILDDFKFTSVWAMLNEKPEWTQQLNIYAWLYRQNGFEVARARIVAVLRDWSKTRAQREPDYPQVGVVVREVPLWSPEKQEDFIRGRLITHQVAENLPDDELPLCSPEERWRQPDTWAVKKRGNKRALRVYGSELDAEEHFRNGTTNGLKLEVEYRPGVDRCCLTYCRVREFCGYYASLKKAEIEDEPQQGD